MRLRTAVRRTALLLLPLSAALLPAAPASAAPAPLTGLFRLTAGSCAGAPAGSWFRMVQPGGKAASGPYVSNSNSTCASDKTYTLLSPGSDGGLRTGGYQPQGAQTLVKAATFFGFPFVANTNAVDPQTGTAVRAPEVLADGSALSGDLRAFGVTWNGQSFNQGAPKPDGSTPGITQRLTGTYSAATGAFSLTWVSQIVGGAFNNFSGVWHLTGTFVPSGTAAATAPASRPTPTHAATGAPTPASAQPAVVATPAAVAGVPTASASATPGATQAATTPPAVAAATDAPTAEPSQAAPVQASSTGKDDGVPTWATVLSVLAVAGAATALVVVRRRGGVA
jgi:hypothetical protein